ncbi:hypothetical protein [Microbacterium soli]|uniref:Alpha/beta hydrolase n=1 Tax=Microbacterium soli TaxID=446075 RepID=A0ABP7N3C4_9MICO
MSGEVEISSGGAISVDSGEFRAVGERLGDLSWELVRAIDVLERAQATLGSVSDPALRARLPEMSARVHRLTDLGRRAGEAARGTQLMADVFELVELRAEQEALAATRPDDALALQFRIDELIASDPVVDRMASAVVTGWSERRFDGVTDQPWDDALGLGGLVGGVLAPAVFSFIAPLMGARPVGATMSDAVEKAEELDRGVLPYGTRLQGAAPAVDVALVATAKVDPVTNLQDSVERIPRRRAAGQVVVERYMMAGEEKRYVAYIGGTRRIMPGSDDPWDMGSNWQMYGQRHVAASYEATLQALAAAGAESGDAVDVVGYSQGAMIGSFLAMDSPYEVHTVIAAGDPVDPALAADQTLVRLENLGDPVVALALGGDVGGTGSPESFTVTGDPERSSPIDPHRIAAYRETARLADASGDPRVQALQETFYGRLREAVTVERMEFTATRR